MTNSYDVSDAVWEKSSYSGGNGGECLEVARLDDLVPVRDSKDAGRPGLVFRGRAWGAFVAAVKDGQVGAG